MDGIELYKKPKLRNPYLIVAWPGMGEVAFKAATYLVNKLKAEEFAAFLPQDFFYLTGSSVQAGVVSLPDLPAGKFYFWKNPVVKRGVKTQTHDLIIFISDAQPDLTKAEEYCMRIIHFARTFNVKMIMGFAAMPQPIDHTHPPHVWLGATSKEILNIFKKLNLQLLNEGQVSGLNGLFLGIAKREGFQGFCLLGEIPLYTIQIDNPKASMAVLEIVATILHIEIDFTEIKEQIQGMDDQINQLLEFLKVGPTQAAPIGEDEIEKIKKSLSQLTKLPISIQEKIEKLFIEAKADVAKAQELKAELDKWNVYKEYEDRFLDLFKKKKEQNN